ncbi:Type I phosphodiesterase / nucleotide pyrophosphatase [Desulfatibacillum alkenivorans DSM 16219]|uniref:Type I phosphodiesterase / nucleotide pyrophosphatase n=1 Tax=Desulfatibacillum alkenivorans DSM 16219 TaxID=1121393 RepID=A0A1M6IU83_9BACT|nr:Type I phosphodiesterase / nucleotide pyrophosphatase [Desulfatibacillum alkenivorans DSM 16219]
MGDHAIPASTGRRHSAKLKNILSKKISRRKVLKWKGIHAHWAISVKERITVLKKQKPCLISQVILFAGLYCLTAPGQAWAYIGPGAGIALAGSYLPAIIGCGAALLLALIWPVRLFLKDRATRKVLKNRPIQKCVILGIDGFDPELAQDFMDQGLLPNFQRLATQGCFKKLNTTAPAITPVAWSTFQTGTNPGKHGIFDFLARSRASYAPVLSSVKAGGAAPHIRLGKFKIPRGVAPQRLLRKSKPFWEILGDKQIYSQILRVPVSFPAGEFHGAILAGAHTPDIRGTQGVFSCYYTGENRFEDSEGDLHKVELIDGTIHGVLTGPADPFEDDGEDLKTSFSVEVLSGGQASLKIGKTRLSLEQGVFSPWTKVRFKAAPGVHVHGICRFLLVSSQPEFALYVSPVHIDPARPAAPISQPAAYASFLARKIGPYATLGMPEDTQALEAGILDKTAFLDQCLSVENERRNMFLHALKTTKQGLIACVFDGPDRIQHCFWDQLQSAGRDQDNPIKDVYMRMDKLAGEALEECRDQRSVFMVASDHGFAPFNHAVDLNCWLEQKGYLKRLENPKSDKNLSSIDWSRTKAYAFGLAGVYLNIKGREPLGIVNRGLEARKLAEKIAGELKSLIHPEMEAAPITNVYHAKEIFKGPYAHESPDLVVGFARGYRVSWETASGAVGDKVFQENNRVWSGDHCVDPSHVPGVLFCNKHFSKEDPHIADIAPTVLKMFGVDVPGFMDGAALKIGKPSEDSVAWRISTPV